MNERAILTILRIVIFVSNAIVFFWIAAFFGGIAYIWGDTFFGTGPGLAIGLVVGLLTGWLAIVILNRLVHWIFPDLREMRRRVR